MFEISILPALEDNYIFVGSSKNRCFVVDPSVASVVLEHIHSRSLILEYILITHHHYDHIGGIAELKNAFKNVNIIVPQKEIKKIVHHTQSVPQNLSIFGSQVLVIDLPGHTIGHVGYYFLDQKILFCGDTLFSAGCGKLFEGTPSDMFCSLNKIKNLPDKTKIYCAHEYTLSNLKFAASIEPNNQDIYDEIEKAQSLRNKNLPTIPSTLEKEKLINPFLRTQFYLQNFKELSEEELFAHLRNMKDRFT